MPVKLGSIVLVCLACIVTNGWSQVILQESNDAETKTEAPKPSDPNEQKFAAKEEAKKHFENGLSLMEVEDFDAAAIEFEASFKAYPTQSALLNLAYCFKALHRYADSLNAFEKVKAEYYIEMTPETRTEVENAISTLRRLIARLDIVVVQEGALVQVDGKDVGTSPLLEPVIVSVGEHQVRVSLDGYVAQDKIIVLVAGAKMEMRFELEQEEAPAPPPVIATTPQEQPTEEAKQTNYETGEVVIPPPPRELDRVFKVYGAGVSMQAIGGVAVVVTTLAVIGARGGEGEAYYQDSFPIVFGAAHAGAAILGGSVAWAVGNKSPHYNSPYWGVMLGGVLGNGLSFGLGMIVWSQTKDDVTDTFFTDNLAPIILGYCLGPLLLPPVFEALFYGLLRKPDERYSGSNSKFRPPGEITLLPPSGGVMALMNGTSEMVPSVTVFRGIF